MTDTTNTRRRLPSRHDVSRLVHLAWRELPWLLVPLVLLVAAWGFVEIAGEVVEGEAQGLDEQVLRALRDAHDPTRTIGPLWLKRAARDVTALGSVSVLTLLCLLVLGYLAMRRLWGVAMFLVASVAGGGLLTAFLKGAFERERPDVVPHFDLVSSFSFPSGHSMMAAIVYLTLGALLARVADRRRIKAYFVGAAGLLALLVGASRVFVGVHYPSDVAAGWLAGLTWASLCWLLAAWLQARGHVAGGAHEAAQEDGEGEGGGEGRGKLEPYHEGTKGTKEHEAERW